MYSFQVLIIKISHFKDITNRTVQGFPSQNHFDIPYLLKLRSSNPLDIGQQTVSMHLYLWPYVVPASSYVVPARSKSFLKVLLHVILGLSCFLIPFDWIHESAVLAHLLSSIQIMCPANFKCRVVIILISVSDWVFLRISTLVTRSSRFCVDIQLLCQFYCDSPCFTCEE